MLINFVTTEELQNFKKELITELSEVITKAKTIGPQKKWLKSYEVREMIGISPGTLQNMRMAGTIEFTKVRGLTFYNYDDIVKMMEKNRKNVKR